MDLDLKQALDGADEDCLMEIVRLAESRLAAQLSTVLACDQRAMTFLGFVTAVAVVLVGTSVSTTNDILATIAGLAGLGFALSGYFAFRAARPVAFETVGNDPSCFIDELKAREKKKKYLSEQALFYDEMLKENRVVMAENSHSLRVASGVAEITVAVGGAFAILYRLALLAS